MQKISLKAITIYWISFCTILNAGASDELHLIDSLKTCNLSETNTQHVVNNHNEIAYLFGAIDTDSSLFYSQKGLTMAKETGYKHGLAVAYSYSARAMIQKGQLGPSIENFKNAVALFTEEKDSVNMLDCYNGLSYVYSYAASQLESLDYNLKALNVAESLKDTANLSIIYNNLGTIYRQQDDYESAIFYFNKSLKINPKPSNLEDLAISHSNIGFLKVEHHKHKEATSNYLELKRLLPSIKSTYLKSYLYLSLSGYYNATGEYDSAKRYIDMADHICAIEDYPQIKVRVYRRTAEMALKQEDYSKSLLFLNKCLDLSDSLGVRGEHVSLYKLQASVYAHLGMYKKAFDASLLAIEASDSLKNKQVANVLGKFEKEQLVKLENERKLLEQQLKDERTENSIVRIRLRLELALTIIILLFVAISIGIYFLLSIKRKNRLMQAQHILIKEQKTLLEDNLKTLAFREKNLQKLNSTKDKLFSIIAHDLKSPFNAILGFTSELSENYSNYSDAERIRMIAMVERASKSTYNLLENLLNWAKSQKGSMRLNKRMHSLKHLINDSISAYHQVALAKELVVHVNIPLELKVWADKETIKIVITNLFNNAIKFSHSKGEIWIQCVERENMVEICIRDTGIGMSDEIIQGLFTIGKDVQRIGTADEKGTGLGLILCQEFVQQNNGQVWAKSDEESGSEFFFTLPKSNNATC